MFSASSSSSTATTAAMATYENYNPITSHMYDSGTENFIHICLARIVNKIYPSSGIMLYNMTFICVCVRFVSNGILFALD